MSAFLLVNEARTESSVIDNARAEFRKKSYELKEQVFSMGEYCLYFYEDLFGLRDKTYINGKGDIFVASGALMYNRKMGVEALKAIDRRLDHGERLSDMRFSGSYVFIVYKSGKLCITGDLLGTMGCYINSTLDWATSNFLSAIVLNGKFEYSRYELLESILFGFTFGYKTVVKDIKLLKSAWVYDLTSQNCSKKKFKIPSLNNNLNSLINDTLDILIDEFEGYKHAFGNKMVSALSGGYDSRLMLALMQAVEVDPELYVYGKPTDKDVVIAKGIAKGENLTLNHIDRSNFPPVMPDDFHRVVERTFYDLDMESNIFSDDSDFTTRITRAMGGGLLMNGSGGEIYRDVWNWGFKYTDLYSLFRNSYDIGQIDRLGVDVNEFFRNIEVKMCLMLSDFFDLEDSISRQQAEMIFPIYRSKFYYPTNTINNYFCSALYPFMSARVVLQSFSIPHKMKRYGEYERLLIKKLNPSLASYQSAYGYNFERGPGLKEKIMDRTYSILSPKVKTTIKSMTTLSKKSLFRGKRNLNLYMGESYRGRLMDINPVNMREYFTNLDKITNTKILERVFNFEYLLLKNLKTTSRTEENDLEGLQCMKGTNHRSTSG